MTLLNKKLSGYKLQISIIKATGLAAADENGYSDPYAVLHIDDKVIANTEVETKTLNPQWQFHHIIPLHKDKRMELIEIYVWDKDRFTQLRFRDVLRFNANMVVDDFLGKITIPVSELFNEAHPLGKEFTLPLLKKHEDDHISGEIHIKVDFIAGDNKKFEEFWSEYIELK